MYLVSGHYRQPLAFSEAALEQAQANVNRIREAAQAPERRPIARRAGSAARRASSTRSRRDFNTPEALAVVNEWIREANRRGAARRAGTPICARCSACSASRRCSTPARRRPPRCASWPSGASRRVPKRDFAAADRLREEIAALGWEVRDGAGGFELLPL